jgi:hypothetical protein
MEFFGRCPTCHRNDRVEKLTAIFNKQDQLALRFRPPENLKEIRYFRLIDSSNPGKNIGWIKINDKQESISSIKSKAFVIGTLIVFFLLIFANSAADSGFIRFVVIVLLLGFSSLIGFSLFYWLRGKQDLENYNNELTKQKSIQLQKLTSRYDKIYYCQRDDLLFIPGEDGSAAASNYEKFLLLALETSQLDEEIRSQAIKDSLSKSELSLRSLKILPKKSILLIIIGMLVVCCLMTLIMSNVIKKAEIARDPVAATINAIDTATQKAIPTQTKTPRPTNTSRPTKTNAPTHTPTLDPEYSVIRSVITLDEDVETHVLNVIHFTGFENIRNATSGPGLDEYSFDSDQGSFIAKIQPDGIYTIVWNEKTLYDIINSIGESVGAYILTDDDKLMYQAWVIGNVKTNLISPSTANFKYQWSFSINENKIVTVQSAVDSENAFGALIKNTVTAQFDHSTTKVLYFEISGNVIFGSPQ